MPVRERVVALCAVLAAAGCSVSAKSAPGAAATHDAGSTPTSDAGHDAGSTVTHDSGVHDAHASGDAALLTPPEVLLLTMKNAAFPGSGHPDIAVHIPPGFDPWNRPGLIVFFHGFDNCVANVVGSVDTACTPGGATRTAMHLVDQLDATKANAILAAVEIDFDQATGVPGDLAKAGVFKAMLEELFTEHLPPYLGRALALTDLDRIVIGSHSGGYEATAVCLSVGEVPEVREIDLYDSLYGYISTFDTWMQDNIARFDPARSDGLRWMDVYTTSGGTDANSMTMAQNASTWLSAANLSASLLADDATDTLAPAAYSHPVIFKHTALTHDETPQYYFQEFTLASGFRMLP